MVQQSNVQANRGIRDDHNSDRRFIPWLARWCRKPLVAYVVIAFAISLSFHELEHRTDRQLARALVTSCLHSNAVRAQFNEQLIALEAEIKPHERKVRLLKFADCSTLPRP